MRVDEHRRARDVLIPNQMLQEFDIDNVIFTKEAEGEYSIDFCHCGTYEKFYGLPDADELEQSE